MYICICILYACDSLKCKHGGVNGGTSAGVHAHTGPLCATPDLRRVSRVADTTSHGFFASGHFTHRPGQTTKKSKKIKHIVFSSNNNSNIHRFVCLSPSAVRSAVCERREPLPLRNIYTTLTPPPHHSGWPAAAHTPARRHHYNKKGLVPAVEPEPYVKFFHRERSAIGEWREVVRSRAYKHTTRTTQHTTRSCEYWSQFQLLSQSLAFSSSTESAVPYASGAKL